MRSRSAPSRRQAGFLVALAVAAGAIVVALLARGGEEAPPPAPTPKPAPTATPAPAPPGRGLAVGITEFNPNFFAAGADLPEPFARWNRALAAIHPALYRLVIDWPSIQPAADRPADLTAYNGGCSRQVPPCQPYGGVRDQLRALASQQRQGGWEGLVVITGTPDWAAQPPGGCERPGAAPRARPPRADALPAYRQLVEAVLALGRQEGASLRYWSAWNEPNHPGFISPQRADCDGPSTAPAAYAEIARTLEETLADAPGDQQLVIGETAGLLKRTRYVTSVPEFIRGLPRDLVCATTVWTQHAYVGGPEPVNAAARALKVKRCPRPHTFWITETGVGPAPRDLSAANAVGNPQEGCRALHARLVRWWRDPRVTAAFQYTFREDDAFKTGLVSSDLSTAHPALAEWTAWGGARDPAAPPPGSTC